MVKLVSSLQDDATSVHADLDGISNKKMKEALSQQLMYMVRLVKTLVKHGQGKLVGNPKQLYQVKGNRKRVGGKCRKIFSHKANEEKDCFILNCLG